jgi:phage terminase large subunit-like protein
LFSFARIRAEPYAAQVQGGNVLVVKGAWNRDFIDEHVAFPVGRAKDQVDAAAAAFNLLTLRKDRAPGIVPMQGLI